MALVELDELAPRPPINGLLTSLQALGGITEIDGPWGNGFEFAPQQCGASGRVPVNCIGNSDEMSADANAATVEGQPFAVYAADECSSFGFEARDWDARVQAQLAATESYEVANELWLGTTAAGEGWPNRALTDAPGSDTVTNGAATPLVALACLEQGLAQCGAGRRGLIHATPQLAIHWASQQLVRREGPLLLTPLNTVVVADAGYTGAAPGGAAAGASQWAYATSMITLLRSPIELVPGSFGEAQARAAMLERTQNTLTIFATRVYGILWDQCCHLAAEVNVATCLIGGAS